MIEMRSDNSPRKTKEKSMQEKEKGKITDRINLTLRMNREIERRKRSSEKHVTSKDL